MLLKLLWLCADIQAEAQRSSYRESVLDNIALAAAAANLVPATAVKSTSDTKSAAPSQTQGPAAVAPSATQDTVTISTTAQTALQESKETQAQTAQEATATVRQ